MSKTVLITGASRGIGKAAALEFARRGYDIVGICLKNHDKLEDVLNEASEFGVRTHCISGVDVGDYESCRTKIFEKLEAEGIRVDCIVNNAGISYIGLLQDMSPKEWNEVISVNLTSVYNISSLFVPGMVRAGGGRIVNVSSVWGNVGASCEVAYSASKGGVNSFTKALAKELAPSNIQVNAIAFGAIDTEMNRFLEKDEREALEEEIPMGRFGAVEEAAKMIADIMEAPAYLTGQVLTMDGGWV